MEKSNWDKSYWVLCISIMMYITAMVVVVFWFKPNSNASKQQAIEKDKNQENVDKLLSGKEILELTTKNEEKYGVVNTTNNPIDYESNYKVYIDFDRNLLIILDK